MEFWSSWNDMYTLAGSLAVATSVSYFYLCSDGACFYQIFARMDSMGGTRCYQHLG